MGNLPPARIDSLRHRPGLVRYWKKLLTIALVLGAGWFFCRRGGSSYEAQELDRARKTNTAQAYVWYAEYHKDPDGVRGDLAALHETARQKIRAASGRPEGLDPVFARLLERVDHKVAFTVADHTVDRASFEAVRALLASPGAEVAPLVEHLGGKQWSCPRGISEAFAELTGSDVIAFDGSVVDWQPQLRMRWTTRASGTGYVEPHSRRIYPGITIEGELELLGRASTIAKATFTVSPPSDIQFTTYGLGNPFGGGNDPELASALGSSACKQAAFVLIEQLTGWKPPPKPVPGLDDRVTRCGKRDGNACYGAAVAYRDGVGVPADPARAAKLFEDGCNTGSLDSARACVEGAALLLELERTRPQKPGSLRVKGEARSSARFMLRKGCEAHDPTACERAGALQLAPRPGGAVARPSDVDEALLWLVRGCDLGSREACQLASTTLANPGVQGTRTHAGALALARRACAGEPACPGADRHAKAAATDAAVFGVPLAKDRVFDIRWGDWYRGDEGQLVAWIASASEPTAVRARLSGLYSRTRVYAVDELPFGPQPPPNTRTVWAVIAGSPRADTDQACNTECKTGEAYEMMYIHGCVCLPLRPK